MVIRSLFHRNHVRSPKASPWSSTRVECLRSQGRGRFSEPCCLPRRISTRRRRFDMGEMANFALLPALLASLNQLNEWQLPRVEHTLREINKEICDHGRRTGLDILPEPFRSPHFTGLRFKNDVPAGLIQNLADQNIFVSARGQSLRVTPHLYNDLDDVDRFFTALSRLL